MTLAQTLIGVGVLLVLIHCSPIPWVWVGILTSGGYRGLGSSSALWSSWRDSICSGGRLLRSRTEAHHDRAP